MARTSQIKAARAGKAEMAGGSKTMAGPKRKKPSGAHEQDQQPEGRDEGTADTRDDEKQENGDKGKEQRTGEKKAATTTKAEEPEDQDAKDDEKRDDDDEKEPSDGDDDAPRKKQKQAPGRKSQQPKQPAAKDKKEQPPPSKKPKKEQRAGSRKSARSGTSSGNSSATQAQILHFLLSPEAEHLCRPEEEEEQAASSNDFRTYGSLEHPLNPFEELISAVILSRPISHRLGLRTIRTVLNEPYKFSSARAVADAGEDKRRQALWDARTQHKDKTASQLGLAAGVVLEKYTTTTTTTNSSGAGGQTGKGKGGGRKSAGGGQSEDDADGETLSELVAQSEQDIDDLLDTLQKDIKGFGKTTAAIFRRRIQWLWEFAYPFVDERTADGLKELGLPIRADALAELIGEHWASDGLKDAEGARVRGGSGGNDEEMRKRRAFAVILERATTTRLEGKVGDVLQAAARQA